MVARLGSLLDRETQAFLMGREYCPAGFIRIPFHISCLMMALCENGVHVAEVIDEMRFPVMCFIDRSIETPAIVGDRGRDDLMSVTLILSYVYDYRFREVLAFGLGKRLVIRRADGKRDLIPQPSELQPCDVIRCLIGASPVIATAFGVAIHGVAVSALNVLLPFEIEGNVQLLLNTLGTFKDDLGRVSRISNELLSRAGDIPFSSRGHAGGVSFCRKTRGVISEGAERIKEVVTSEGAENTGHAIPSIPNGGAIPFISLDCGNERSKMMNSILMALASAHELRGGHGISPSGASKDRDVVVLLNGHPLSEGEIISLLWGQRSAKADSPKETRVAEGQTDREGDKGHS